MVIRTDLAQENDELNNGSSLYGVDRKREQIDDIEVSVINISDPHSAQILGKPIGEYITIEPHDLKVMPANFETIIEVVAQNLQTLLPKTLESVLVVGLGNTEITPDALGPKTIRYTLATRHIMGDFAKSIGLSSLNSVSAIATGVLGQTGIESGEIIKAVTDKINPSVVIVIDALACKNVDRLGKTVQIANTGISPGSGVQNKRLEISESFLGVPVISVGIPMVVDLHTIASDYIKDENLPIYSNANMMVTPREIDVLIEHAGKLLGFAINKALQPHLDIDDIMALVG